MKEVEIEEETCGESKSSIHRQKGLQNFRDNVMSYY